MANSSELLQKALREATNRRGDIADLARKAGLKPPQMQRYISGDHVPSLDNLDRIASALGKEAWELIKPHEASSKLKGSLLPEEVREALREELDKRLGKPNQSKLYDAGGEDENLPRILAKLARLEITRLLNLEELLDRQLASQEAKRSKKRETG